MSKKFVSIVITLVMILALPLQAFAMAEVSAELPFSVENVGGTVVIEGVDGAPLPELTVLKDVTGGVFKLSFSQPDTYRYRVYQQVPENANGVIYDTKVYNVTVSVLADNEGALNCVFTISIDGFAEKHESIVFVNELPEADEDPPGQTSTAPNSTTQTTLPPSDTTQTTLPPSDTTQTTLPSSDTTQTTLSPNETTQTSTSQPETPDTGDNGNLGMWLLLSALSLAGLFMVLFAARREKVR